MQLGNTYTGQLKDIPDFLSRNHMYLAYDTKELYGFNTDGTHFLLAPSPYVVASAFSGVDTKTLTLTLSDNTTVVSSWDPTTEVIEDVTNGNSFFLRDGNSSESGTSGENISMGYNNTFTYGWGNFVTGTAHQIAGNSTTVGGYSNVVENNIFGSAVLGTYNTVRTNYSAIFGYNNQDRHPVGGALHYPDGGNLIGGFNNYVNDGMAIGMFGSGQNQTGNNLVVVGQAAINLSGSTKNVNQPNDARFIVGNGTIQAGSYYRQTPSNAFVVYHSGLVVAPSLTSTLIDTQARALVTREYLSAKLPTATTVSATNNNPTLHDIATVNGTVLKETVTKLNTPTLSGNILTLKFLNEIMLSSLLLLI
jgi:hypothetical protein